MRPRVLWAEAQSSAGRVQNPLAPSVQTLFSPLTLPQESCPPSPQLLSPNVNICRDSSGLPAEWPVSASELGHLSARSRGPVYPHQPHMKSLLLTPPCSSAGSNLHPHYGARAWAPYSEPNPSWKLPPPAQRKKRGQ